MKKSLRIFALMMAALTALSVMSVTMATMPKNYIGIAEADGNSFMYAKPDKSSGYIYIDVNKPFVTNGTEMWLFDISDNYEWCYVGFSQYTGWMQTDDLKIELRAGIVLRNATVDKNGKVVVNSNALSNQPPATSTSVRARAKATPRSPAAPPSPRMPRLPYLRIPRGTTAGISSSTAAMSAT